jgi:hypothetical protein
MIRPYDAWYVGGVLCGFGLRGDPQNVSEPWRSLCPYLAGLPTSDILTAAWKGYLLSRADRDSVVQALADVDPSGPPPEITAALRFANVGDIRHINTDTSWRWDGWIPKNRIFGLAGNEGTGKTRTAMDLHARVWHGRTWPDGQAATVEPGRPAVWVCSDGHQDELVELLPAFDLPDEAVYFPAPPEEPYEGTDLDASELTTEGGILEQVITTVKPWCVFIDTLTNATSRDLCEQKVMKGIKAPLVRMAQTLEVNICLLLHLSEKGNVLGRRIKGSTRTLLHLDCSDPDNHPERLRFWVEKSYAKKPPALGVTLGSDGNDYDFDPPRKSDPSKPRGRPSDKREKAVQFIRDALRRQDGQKAKSLCSEWEEGGESHTTFWNARDVMVAAGEITCDGTPLVMRLKAPSANGFHQEEDPF